jgi:hypothetical protein
MSIAEHKLDFGPTSDRTELKPSSDRDDELTFNSAHGTDAATTFYADDVEDSAKWERLWTRNAGVDGHRADGRSTGDVHKVNENTRQRRERVELVASHAEVSRRVREEAVEIADGLDARSFGPWGGRDALALAAVQYVAEYDCTTVPPFAECVENWLRNGERSLRSAVKKITEIRED